MKQPAAHAEVHHAEGFRIEFEDDVFPSANHPRIRRAFSCAAKPAATGFRSGRPESSTESTVLPTIAGRRPRTIVSTSGISGIVVHHASLSRTSAALGRQPHHAPDSTGGSTSMNADTEKDRLPESGIAVSARGGQAMLRPRIPVHPEKPNVVFEGRGPVPVPPERAHRFRAPRGEAGGNAVAHEEIESSAVEAIASSTVANPWGRDISIPRRSSG